MAPFGRAPAAEPGLVPGPSPTPPAPRTPREPAPRRPGSPHRDALGNLVAPLARAGQLPVAQGATPLQRACPPSSRRRGKIVARGGIRRAALLAGQAVIASAGSALGLVRRAAFARLGRARGRPAASGVVPECCHPTPRRRRSPPDGSVPLQRPHSPASMEWPRTPAARNGSHHPTLRACYVWLVRGPVPGECGREGVA